MIPLIPLLVIGAIALAGAAFFKNAAGAGETSAAEDVDGGAMTDWTRFDGLFKKYGEINSVPWEWLKAIAIKESDLGRDPLVVAGKVSRDRKSWGLMQLTLPTAGDYKPDVTVADLNDHETSIDLAAQHLGFLFRRYGGDPRKVIMSYNQGHGNTDAGKTYAFGYFQEWQKNLKRVEENIV